MKFRSGIRSFAIILLCFIFISETASQCGLNELINPGFETVDPPCGMVPPGGLINGSFNQGCMTGWESAWGTPSVCSNNPYEGNYYACLGANNEGFLQTVMLDAGDMYCLSFQYRRLNSGSGSLNVYLANGLVNQPMSNSGNPPLTIQPEWQLLGTFPSTGNAWIPVIISSFTQLDPANNQLLFLDVPSSGLDVGIDDVLLTVISAPDPDVVLDFQCVNQDGGEFTFEGSITPLPDGWENGQWIWSFGDGNTGSGQTVTHTYSDFGTYEICLTFILNCGCEYIYCEYFEYNKCLCACTEDTEGPAFVNFDPAPVEVFCIPDIPAPVMPVIDDCDPSAFLLFNESSTGPPCDQVIYYEWTAVDLCGNFTLDTQVVHYQDTLAPLFIDLPYDLHVDCPDHQAVFLQWISEFGGAWVTDECDNFSPSVAHDPFPEGNCGEVTVTFIATDACANMSSAEATFSFSPMEEMELTFPPADLVFECTDPDINEIELWLNNLAGAEVFAPCDIGMWSNDFDGNLSADSVEVTFTAEDVCPDPLIFTAWIIQVYQSDTLYQQLSTCDPLMTGADTIVEMNGTCATVIISTTSLQSADTTLIMELTCDLSAVGTDTAFLQNQSGCDSLVITIISSAGIDVEIVEETTICGDGVPYSDTLTIAGMLCDTTLITMHTFVPYDTVYRQEVVCMQGAAYTDTIILAGVLCDTILITAYTFIPPDTIYLQEIICMEGNAFSDTILRAGLPCDTVVITSFLFFAPDTTHLTEVVCSPADTGMTTIIWNDIHGCDSTVLTHYTYKPPEQDSFYHYTCFGLDTMVEGLVYANQAGCDSLIVTHILINATPDTQFVQAMTCDSTLTGSSVTIIPGEICDTIRVTENVWIPFQMTSDTQLVCSPAEEGLDSLFFSTQEGCDSIVLVYKVEHPPDVEYLVLDESCLGMANGSILIENVTGGQEPFLYSLNGDIFSSAMNWSALPAGKYNIIIMDATGCQDTFEGIEVDAGPEFFIDAGPDRFADIGDILAIQAISGQLISTITWLSLDDVECPACVETTLGPVTSEQLVQVSALSESGCADADTFYVYLNEEESYYVPNVFSPNGDGINDVFSLYTNVKTQEQVFTLSIFDRWGNLVFFEERLVSGQTGAGWDGTFNGKDVSPGVYTYLIVLKNNTDEERQISGDLTLIR